MSLSTVVLLLLYYWFLVSSDRTFLVKSNALQQVNEPCCHDCCTFVSWDLWIGDCVCSPSGNECVRDGKLSRVCLFLTQSIISPDCITVASFSSLPCIFTPLLKGGELEALCSINIAVKKKKKKRLPFRDRHLSEQCCIWTSANKGAILHN